jgi:hypothetical protein
VLIYDSEQVAMLTFKFLSVKIRIWDLFSNVRASKETITLKFTSKNPYFQMPSISNVVLSLNIPPQDCSVEIRPKIGNAITAMFRIITTNCVDEDLPLSYQYTYYMSQLLFDADIFVGQNLRKTTVTDPTDVKDFSTILPTPMNEDGSVSDKLVIIVGVFDSLGSV